MLNNFDYLWKRLLCVCVCVCVNSTFGRCCHCPCGKETVEGKKEDVEKIINTENNLILDTPLMNNPAKGKNKLNDTLAGYKYFPNPKDQNESLINEIIKEALKNNVVCDVCINNKDSESKIKVVFDDPAARVKGNKGLKTVDLGFDFCEKHKKCIVYLCKGDAEFLFQCGHRMCETHYREKTSGEKFQVWSCDDCNICMCCLMYRERFDTHLRCNAPGNKHYVCFHGSDGKNPYKQNDPNYYENTWICPEHQAK